MRIRLHLLLIIAATAMPGLPTAYGLSDGAVFRETRWVQSEDGGTGRTFIRYPPFDPSMVDIEIYGDEKYHWPDLAIDLTAEMVSLDQLKFELDATLSSEIIALPRAEDPDATYDYLFHLDLEIESPRDDHGFAADVNQIIQPGIGPGSQFLVRQINMAFEIDEYIDLSGVIPMSLRGFDAPLNPFAATRRANFVLRPEFGVEPHYFYIEQNFTEEVHKPHDAVVYTLHVDVGGFVHIDYHFSLNYDAVDHAILFDQFRCPDIGWDVSETGTVTLMDEAIRLTTQSPVSISRSINTPDWPLLMMFDQGFLTNAGVLEVRLDDHLLFSADAADSAIDEMRHYRLLIVDRELLGRDNIDLVFSLNGPAGSQAVLDNIGVFPFLQWQPPTLDSAFGHHDDAVSSERVIAIESELPWNAQADVDWITITDGAAGDGSGTLTYHVADNPSGGARTGTITIQGGGIERRYHVQQGIPINYEQWLQFYFPDDPQHGEPDMDFSGNGVFNLLEYALGGNPRESATCHRPKPVIRKIDSDQHFAISFPRNVYAEDLILHVEASHDLENWERVGTVSDEHSDPESTDESGNTEATVFSLTEPLHSQTTTFLRLLAELTE